ncbi:MAG: glutamate racemase [Candidatus Saccharimonadales bacterium]
MKIGIFDSGLGGLIIAHALTKTLPKYDYIYLGDTARVPYGNRSHDTVYEFTLQAVNYLIAEGCGLIIIACNTASAEALRRLQQTYLPGRHPHVTVLGVLIPAAEAAAAATRTGRIGVLATSGTVASGAFDRELSKLRPDLTIISQAAPLLVPLVEYDGLEWAQPILAAYLKPLHGIDTLILGCTHYPFFKDDIRRQVGDGVAVISQDEFIPAKLAEYLGRHANLATRLTSGGTRRFAVTDKTDQAARLAENLYGRPIQLELVDIS